MWVLVKFSLTLHPPNSRNIGCLQSQKKLLIALLHGLLVSKSSHSNTQIARFPPKSPLLHLNRPPLLPSTSPRLPDVCACPRACRKVRKRSKAFRAAWVDPLQLVKGGVLGLRMEISSSRELDTIVLTCFSRMFCKCCSVDGSSSLEFRIFSLFLRSSHPYLLTDKVYQSTSPKGSASHRAIDSSSLHVYYRIVNKW